MSNGYWNNRSACRRLAQFRNWPAFEPDDLTKAEASRDFVSRASAGFDACAACLVSAERAMSSGDS